MKVAQAAEMPNFGWVYAPDQSILNLIELWAKAHQYSVMLGLAVAVGLLLLLELWALSCRPKSNKGWWRGNVHQLLGGIPRMSRKARAEHKRRFFEDGNVEFVEDGVYRGVITREDAKEYYLMIANWCGLKGLFPKTDQGKLKQELLNKHPDKPVVETELGRVFVNALNKPRTAKP